VVVGRDEGERDGEGRAKTAALKAAPLPPGEANLAVIAIRFPTQPQHRSIRPEEAMNFGSLSVGNGFEIGIVWKQRRVGFDDSPIADSITFDGDRDVAIRYPARPRASRGAK